jgi:hypothetical protein
VVLPDVVPPQVSDLSRADSRMTSNPWEKVVAGKTVSLFADETVLKGSVHARLECTACHAGISEIPHPEKLAPVCTDCHGEHSIRAAQDPESRVSVANVSQTCASCHEAQGISERYGIPSDRLETYADSFHGLAVRGGSKVAANCASCHGVHDIRPSSDPKSAISKENLPATCGKCHPRAGARFAEGRVHVEKANRAFLLTFSPVARKETCHLSEADDKVA